MENKKIYPEVNVDEIKNADGSSTFIFSTHLRREHLGSYYLSYFRKSFFVEKASNQDCFSMANIFYSEVYFAQILGKLPVNNIDFLKHFEYDGKVTEKERLSKIVLNENLHKYNG